jgi:ATP-binding cassette subfamily D (ALD) long-chain fatty acid import protein
LEGELRFTHSRLLESAEEVAFYHGEEFEKNVIERGYFALVKYVNRILRIRVWHGMAEEGVIKWLWGSFGLGICAIPVFAGASLGMDAGDLGSRTEGKSYFVPRGDGVCLRCCRICYESKTAVVG